MSGEAQQAHVILDELLKEDPKDAETLLQKGQMLLNEGKRDEALEHVRTAATARPNSAMAQSCSAKSTLRAGTSTPQKPPTARFSA